MLLCSSRFIFLYSLVNNDGVVLSFVAVLFKLLLNSILCSGFLFSLGWDFLFSWLLSVAGFLSDLKYPFCCYGVVSQNFSG